jgi:hypothetical protein
MYWLLIDGNFGMVSLEPRPDMERPEPQKLEEGNDQSVLALQTERSARIIIDTTLLYTSAYMHSRVALHANLE